MVGERRASIEDRGGRIPDEDREAIAQRAAEIVAERFTLAVGKWFLRRVFAVGGVVALAVGAWLHGAGKITLGG
jgi:hypothetical protein